MNQEATNRGSMSSPRKDLVLRITMELAHPFLKTYRITAARPEEPTDSFWTSNATTAKAQTVLEAAQKSRLSLSIWKPVLDFGRGVLPTEDP
ncbi:hypothetical protein G5I_03808 [Acromyrmex echinatior]|uniref:Uncharacterized protein n=1 Tax=Acromyrmex echinatior TaxID=103372 RepID=F4WDY3_ACREC|nr:hypothetical protein G5I_03808 [Acromyrmex echinatior]